MHQKLFVYHFMYYRNTLSIIVLDVKMIISIERQ